MQVPKFESDRISVVSTKEKLHLEITGKIPEKELRLLGVWLLAWTISGFIVISQIFYSTGDQRIFMLVWLAFWGYFEFRIGKAWLWRKYGKEVLDIDAQNTTLSFDVPFGGVMYSFQTADIRNLKNLEKEKGDFVKKHFQSFWVIGGETVGFFAKGKLQTFGRQLSAGDADKLIALVQKRIP